MSDDDPNQTVLKAGHPPAVKVAGGVRITQHKSEKSIPIKKQNSKDENNDDDDEEQSTVPESPPKPMITSISGAPVRGFNEDFPAKSIQAYHDKKPMPTNECRPINRSNHCIQQPKK